MSEQVILKRKHKMVDTFLRQQAYRTHGVLWRSVGISSDRVQADIYLHVLDSYTTVMAYSFNLCQSLVYQ